MNPIRRLPFVGFLGALALLAAGPALAADAPPASAASLEERVVYHVNDMATAREALVNVGNHLAASPKARITLVANGRGIFMMVKGEKDRVGEYTATIAELQAKGVKFDACRNSMTQRNLEPSAIAAGVTIVPAGVAELARLQGQERYAYIKP